MDFSETMDWIAKGFEVRRRNHPLRWSDRAGIDARAEREGRLIHRRHARPLRSWLLLGLEVLVAADIIQTVTVDESFENVLSLGVLVLVLARVVLSFSLEIELDGMLPWRKAPYKREESAARGPVGG